MQGNDKGISYEVLSGLENTNSIKKITDLSSNTNMTKTINDFVNDTTVLDGEQWKKIKGKFSNYNTLLSERSTVASDLSTAISSAIKLLIDYLGEDTYLTPEVLDELNQEKEKIEKRIENIVAETSKMTEIIEKDSAGNIIHTGKYKYVYTLEERRDLMAPVWEYRNKVIPEINRLIAKVEGLPEIYKQAEGIIEEAYTKIETFNGKVMEIQSSKPVIML